MHHDTDGTIARLVEASQRWLLTQTIGRWFRYDTYQGQLDITFVQLSQTDASIGGRGASALTAIVQELRSRGFTAPDKLYGVVLEGGNSAFCGFGEVPGDYFAIFLNGTPPGAPPCNSNAFGAPSGQPNYWTFTFTHETFHTLGAVPACAPHWAGNHTNDRPDDLMYAGPKPWVPALLDPGHDDYFATGRADCPDAARADLFVPAPWGASPKPIFRAIAPAAASDTGRPVSPVPGSSQPPRGFSTLSPVDCGLEPELRSLTANAASSILFRNTSERERRVYWLDYTGTGNSMQCYRVARS